MTEPTIKLTVEDHLLRLSRTAEELRGRLASHRKGLAKKRVDLPEGVMVGLRQLSGSLLSIQKTVEEISQERRSLLALAEIGQVINSSLDLQTVLNEVMDTLIRLTKAERAFLMLKNEKGEMQTPAARNWERQSLDPGEIEVSQTIVDRVVRRGESILTTNAQTDPRFDSQESVMVYNLRSILCVPLTVKGKLTGVIYADNKAREGLFTEKERSLLAAFANQAAVAIENARLFDSVRRTLDEVTELKNLMEDVFKSIVSGVITSNIDDKITLCNEAAQTILAKPHEQLLGTSLHDLLPELSPNLLELMTRAKDQDERFVGVEINPILPDRGEVDLTINISPLKSADEATKGVAIVVDDLTEKRKLEAQRRLFEKMVSPAVIQQLDPDSLQLGGTRVEITTLFADIRGFTAFGETTDPETLVGVLNRYLAAAAESVLTEEGTIDKFLGDAVMAWFNAPILQPDHALRAVRAALAIRASTRSLHKELPEAYHLPIGIGIHCGDAVLGLVGTEKRLNYTAIGDSVNTAKRLQENATGWQILISKAVVDQVGDSLRIKEVEPIWAEGKEHPVEVFEVIELA